MISAGDFRNGITIEFTRLANSSMLSRERAQLS